MCSLQEHIEREKREREAQIQANGCRKFRCCREASHEGVCEEDNTLVDS